MHCAWIVLEGPFPRMKKAFAESTLSVYRFPQLMRVHYEKRSCLKKADSVSIDCPHHFEMMVHSSYENNCASYADCPQSLKRVDALYTNCPQHFEDRFPCVKNVVV